MFEDATFDARGAVRNDAPRWMMLTAAANAAVVAGLVIAPLLYSRSLAPLMDGIKAPIFTPPPEPVRLVEQKTAQSERQTMMALPVPNTATHIGRRPTDAGPAPEELRLGGGDVGSGAAVGAGAGDNLSVFHDGNSGQVKQETPAVARVSSGVVEGLLLPHAAPAYPAIARSVGIGGEVMLEAVISTEGRVEKLHVISGHPLLQQAAIDAVKDWRYKPYLLHGKAVEVDTTITIRFSLHGR